jgi:hypothetical protein
MKMRPRINALTFRPRPGLAGLKGLKGLKGLTGLTALTALATLAVPAVASAATPAAPPAAPLTQTIANQANGDGDQVPPLRRRRDRLPGGRDIGAEPSQPQRD